MFGKIEYIWKNRHYVPKEERIAFCISMTIIGALLIILTVSLLFDIVQMMTSAS